MRHRDFVKVRREGGTIVLSVGKLIPKDFKIVTLVPVDKVAGKSVTIRVDKRA